VSSLLCTARGHTPAFLARGLKEIVRCLIGLLIYKSSVISHNRNIHIPLAPNTNPYQSSENSHESHTRPIQLNGSPVLQSTPHNNVLLRSSQTSRSYYVVIDDAQVMTLNVSSENMAILLPVVACLLAACVHHIIVDKVFRGDRQS